MIFVKPLADVGAIEPLPELAEVIDLAVPDVSDAVEDGEPLEEDAVELAVFCASLRGTC